MAKIAVEEIAAGGTLTTRSLAQGDGWAVSDMLCNAGPHTRPFEEQHFCPTVAIVVGGTFQYRSQNSREFMTPGSILLGSAGQSFECGHEHATGDRCISFAYTPEFFERLTLDAGGCGSGFRTLRLPPIRPLSPLIARASAGLAGSSDAPWEEISIQLAAAALQLDRGLPPGSAHAQPGAMTRVTRIVRMIECHPEGSYLLANLAQEARLSPYHFLRMFQSLTGVTPHQYLLRVRLRQAAIRLMNEATKILDIALDCSFGDISNFNRTFRAEFGVSPRSYRNQTRGTLRPLPPVAAL